MFGSKLPDSYRLSTELEQKCIDCRFYLNGMCDKFKTMVLTEFTCDEWKPVNVI